MSHSPALAALLKKLEHPALKTIDLSLGRMERFLEVLGNPQEKLPPEAHPLISTTIRLTSLGLSALKLRLVFCRPVVRRYRTMVRIEFERSMKFDLSLENLPFSLAFSRRREQISAQKKP